MFAKGNKMIPLVRDWRELSKGVLGVDYQGKEGKGSEVGAISAHPVPWPLLSPGYPQEGECSQHFPFPAADHLPLPPFPYSLFALSPPVLHSTSARILPLPFPSCSGLLIPALVPIASCITHQLLTATPACGPTTHPDPGPKWRGLMLQESDKG